MSCAVTDKTFEKEVLKASTSVLVDFWAEWCAPCKSLAPILDEIEKSGSLDIKIANLNVDDNPKIAKEYGIRGVPTLLLFKDGKEAAKQVGLIPKQKIIKWIEQHI